MRRLLSSFIIFATAVTASLFAWAAATGEATLNAVAFEHYPADASIQVSVLDDSEENLAIAAELQRALTERGFSLASDHGPLVLTLETGNPVGASRTTSGTDRVRIMDDRGRLFPDGEIDVTRQVRLPLPRTTVVTPAQYRIGLTIDDRASGGRVWEGWAIADLSQGEPAELARAMVPRLVDSIGHTVREQVFTLE
jgi:hypothetical protein